MKAVQNYVFASTVMLRTPAFSYALYNRERFENCFENQWLRTALQAASDSLYQDLEKKGFDLTTLDQRSQIAVRKYFNRICFRPTPFGLFAGIAALEWGTGDQLIKIITSKTKIHCLYSYKHLLQNAHIASGIKSIKLFTNDTLYRSGNDYRYLRYEFDQEQNKRQFFINTISGSKPLNLVLNYCRKGRTSKQLISFLMRKFGITKDEAELHQATFLKDQLFVTASLPKISGVDQPQRLSLAALQNRLKAGSGANYINFERTDITGRLDRSLQQQILSALECLDRLYPYHANHDNLTLFAQKFKERYEGNAIPLLQALDPEIGIGYLGLEASMVTAPLLKDITWPERTATTNLVGWQAVHALLLQKWINIKGDALNKYTIHLDRTDIDKLLSNQQQVKYPPSISVLFRMIEGKVYIEEAGGVTATSLTGRFTLFNDQIYKSTLEIAGIEHAANPDVLFAEIVHTCDTHSANIDRRKTIRSYEIPVLTGSHVKPDNQLPLSDLFIKIVDSELILFSKKHHKRVIPRLSSAFNHQLSQLAAFRFLCDLQSHHLKTGFGFHLKNVFPDLDFYPRLEFESVILQLATWQVKKEVIGQVLSGESFGECCKRLSNLSQELNWPQFIALSEHDNQLVFDMSRQWDVEFLCRILKKGQALYVTEFPFTKDEKPLIKDQHDNPYSGQFVASLYHEYPVYKPYNQIKDTSSAKKTKRHFLPGSEWLYLKIYCHQARANHILTDKLWPLIRQDKKIANWFFIRYADPEHHLRLRINLHSVHVARIIRLLEKCLTELIVSGIVRDYQFAVYERELERYGPGFIGDIELAFGASSELIIQHLLKENIETYSYYQSGFNDVQHLLDIFKIPLQDRIGLFEKLYTQLFSPYHADSNFYKQLNSKYREVFGLINKTPFTDLIEDNPLKVASIKFNHSYNIVAHKAGYSLATNLLADLIHMHLNRLLSQGTQKQEAIFYYYLWKYYVSEQAQINNKPITNP